MTLLNKNIGVALLVLAFGLIQGCCQPDEKIEDPCGQACLLDEKCDNGRCVCENDGIRIGNRCIEITDRIYYAQTNNCNCIDEILLNVFKQNQSEQFTYVGANIYFQKDYSYIPTWGHYYNDFNGGGYDSFVLFDINRPRCEINGKAYSALLAGKFVGQDSIDAWIKWYEPVAFPTPPLPIVDSCHVFLVKPKR